MPRVGVDADRDQPTVYRETHRDLPPDPRVHLAFEGAPSAVSRLRVEVRQLLVGERAKIHVRDLLLR